MSLDAFQAFLFPPSLLPLSGFSTASFVNSEAITQVELADKALGVTKVSSGTTHPVVPDPLTGQPSWKATYPEGSFSPSGDLRGGFGFYLAGPSVFMSQLANATEVLTSYAVMFQDDWEWQKGGKLPGQYGGIGDLAFACSGGRQEDREQCFDLRFMWRTDGDGELYTYLPLTDQNAAIIGQVPPRSILNSDFGYSVGRGAWVFNAGSWNFIAERVKLNDPDKTNGEVEVWINGTSVINVFGLEMRNSTESIFRGMHFQTFFGGSTSDYASPQNQSAYFAFISGAILA